MSDFFLFTLYLFYGLAFFATGVAVTSKISRASKLTINRHLWLFALFAFTHAGCEWLELFIILEFEQLPKLFIRHIHFVNFLPAFVSYCFLMLFGVILLGEVYPANRWYFRMTIPLLFGILYLAINSSGAVEPTAIQKVINQRMRNFIGFPAAVLAGYGLISYAATVRDTSVRVARNFVAAGVTLMIYGVLTGLIPSRTILPLPIIPVEVLRATTAIIMLHFIIQALRLFNHERQARLEKSMERFTQSEKLTALGKLAAGIAHEINNPLTNVSLNVEMLKRDLPDADPYAKRFTAIERNLERASRIARELLAFSRQDQKEELPSPVDLNEILRDTLLLLGPRQQEFEFELDLAPLPRVEGLYWKIEEVFLNIIINAMEACDREKRISIRSRLVGPEIVLTFRDQGQGIPPDNLRLIFDPFFTTKDIGKGTGLGLSICLGIMERHGGSIDVTSTPGTGTTVRLTFPTGGIDGE